MKSVSRFLPDIPGLYCLTVFLLLTGFGGELLFRDADTLWHIESGRVMLEQQSLLTRDVFSHTADGSPWIAHEWLAEILMAGLYNVSGLAGVGTFFALLVALTFWLLLRIAMREATAWAAICAVSLALVVCFGHLLARPHIFSWLFGVVTLGVLMRGGRGLWLLPPLMIPWANLHGGFVLGLVLQALFLLGMLLERGEGQRDRHETLRSLVVLGLSLAATGLNPFGYELLLFPFHVMVPAFTEAIAEWQPPNLRKEGAYRIFLVALLLLLAVNRQRLNPTRILLMVFFVYTSFLHARNPSLAALFLGPSLALLLSFWGEGAAERLGLAGRPSGAQLPLSRVSGVLGTSLLAALAVLSAGFHPGLKSALIDSLFPLPSRFSAAAAAYINEHPPQGRMLNQYALGGYLIFALDPQRKVFIDGRADMYGEEIFEDYLEIERLGERADELLVEYGIGWAIFEREKPIVRYLKQKPGWRETYRDDQVSILETRSAGR